MRVTLPPCLVKWENASVRKLLQELREALGRMEGRGKINQRELGALLHPPREISAMQGYERGVEVPKEFVAQFAQLARKAGRPLLAQQFEAHLKERAGEPAKPTMTYEEAIFVALEEIRVMSGRIEQIAKAVSAQQQPGLRRGKR
jgi:hypothetical protein